MLRKTMIALCAVASVGMLAPNLALARAVVEAEAEAEAEAWWWWRRHAVADTPVAWAEASARAAAVASLGEGFGGGGSFGNSFARAAPGAGVGAVRGNRVAGGSFQGNRFSGANFEPILAMAGFGHGFHHGRHFFAGVASGVLVYDDYWDYPDYAYDDFLLRQWQLLCRAAARSYAVWMARAAGSGLRITFSPDRRYRTSHEKGARKKPRAF